MGAFKLAEKTDKATVQDYVNAAMPDVTVKQLPGVAFSVGTSNWVGTAIAVNGKRINTTPMAHGLGMIGLMFLIFLTGIGIVIYAVTAMKQQRALQKRVDGVLAGFEASLAAPPAADDAPDGAAAA